VFAVESSQQIVVVGAGISGLACAYRLRQLGHHPLVLEATERAGGVIATVRKGGFLFETGPQSPRFPAPVWQLVRELRLEGEFVAGNPKAKRYILWQGQLHVAPLSPASLITTRLVGLKSKLRVLREAFGYTQPPNYEESLAAFVQRKFGTDVLENLVDPLIFTIFFGDAHKMGMQSAFPALVEWERSHGSLVRGALRARKKSHNTDAESLPANSSAYLSPKSLRVTDALPALGSFQSGMAALPERLTEELKAELCYGAEVASIAVLPNEKSSPGFEWQIRLNGGEQISTRYLVLAVPAYIAARLLEVSFSALASLLRAIAYAPICVVSSAYKRSDVAHTLDGFGFMVPRSEGLHTTCTFWNSSLFADRAPGGALVITSFAGRTLNAAVEAKNGDEYAQIIGAENARILGISAPPLERVVWRDSRALPQYNVGHAGRVAEIYDILRVLPNLRLIGNFLQGRSIGDCVQVASCVAEDLHSQLLRCTI